MNKKTKAVLINPSIPQLDNDKMQPPGGLISIATLCQSEGYEVEVIDLAGKGNDDDLLRYIPEANVYGISLYTVTYYSSVILINELRKRNSLSVFVAGGPHASALPHSVKQDFDCVVCGEGEFAFLSILNLVENSAPHRVPEIIYAAPIVDPDRLPFPDFYRNSDIQSYSRHILGMPSISIDSSRGCNHSCRFCNSRVIERGSWRARSPENVVAEVKWHISNNFVTFRFNDDNFLGEPQRAFELCKLLEPLGIKYRIFARAESLTEQLCRALVKSGCVHVGVGIESMSETILTQMGKDTNVSSILKGISAARDAGIKTRGFFICGFPGETNDTVIDSIEGLNKLYLDEAIVYPCIPYPGTDLFTQPEKFGITWIDPDYSKFIQVGANKTCGFVMETHGFGIEDVVNWRDLYIEAFKKLYIAWSGEGGIV